MHRHGRALVRLILLLVALVAAAPALAGTLLVDFLDVGQGDSILVRGGGKAVLVDAGDSRSGVVDMLRAMGVERLDLVVASHAHSDHIGSMEEVLRAFDVGLYMDNGKPHTTSTYEQVMSAVEELGIPYRTARTGTELRLGDEATIRVLLPGEKLLSGTRSDHNSNSVVLLVEHGDNRILLPGDAEEPTERLVVRQEIGPVTLLKVPHHGGAHSTNAALLREVQPEYAVISVGEDNRYGHPSDKALLRLEEAGAMVFRTDLSGHVRAISTEHGMEMLEGHLDELGPGLDDRGELVILIPAAPYEAAGTGGDRAPPERGGTN